MDSYEGPVSIYIDEELVVEGMARLVRQPSPGDEGSWYGDIVVEGVAGVDLLRATRIRLPSEEERDIHVNGLNLAGSDEGIAQGAAINGFGPPPF